jgi:hypothetical protein
MLLRIDPDESEGLIESSSAVAFELGVSFGQSLPAKS